MEIVKSPEGNYHIAANKDEWFVIHFFMNFFNENYDEIDEGILFHFGVEEDVAKIAEKVNKSHIPDRDENYLILEDKEMELFVDLMRDSVLEQTHHLRKFSEEKNIRKFLFDTYDNLSDKYFSIVRSRNAK